MPLGRVAFNPSGYGTDNLFFDGDVTPYFGHQEITVASPPESTYTLPDLPFTESVVVALDGEMLRFSADYDVDVNGVVTMHAEQHAGQKLVLRWCAKEHWVY